MLNFKFKHRLDVIKALKSKCVKQISRGKKLIFAFKNVESQGGIELSSFFFKKNNLID